MRKIKEIEKDGSMAYNIKNESNCILYHFVCFSLVENRMNLQIIILRFLYM